MTVSPKVIIFIALFLNWLLFFTTTNGNEYTNICQTVTKKVDKFIDDSDDGQREPARKLKRLKANCPVAELGPFTAVYDTKREGLLPVQCPRNQVLFDLDVKVKPEETSVYKNCWGLTPELLASKHECFWQSKCGLRYHPTFIMWSPPDEPSCVAAWPGQIEVTPTCLDTADHPISDVIKYQQHVKSISGLIRSHFDPPHGESNYPKADRMYPPQSRLDLYPPETKNSSTFLMLHFITFDLAKDDSLSLLHPSMECPQNWTKGATYVVNSGNLPKLSLIFSLQSSTRFPSKEGFKICFKWFTSSNASAVMRKFQWTINRCKKRIRSTDESKIPVYDVIRHIDSQNTFGVVRSHPSYPWNYPRPLIPGVELSGAVRSAIHELRAPSGMTSARISIGQLSLAEGDFLYIGGCNGTDFLAKCGDYYDISGDKVTLDFKIRASNHATHQGFVLCYHWFSSRSVRPLGDDLCERFTSKVKCKKRTRKGKNKKEQGKGRKRRRKKRKARKKNRKQKKRPTKVSA